MQPTNIQRPRDIQALAADFVRAARSGHGSTEGILGEICTLSNSQAAQLCNSAIELCSVRLRHGNADEVFRSHLAGAQLILQCGLSFDSETVNRKILPLLVSVPADIVGRKTQLVDGERDGVWCLRLQRILALGQLAPHIHESRVDDALRAMIAHSEIGGKMRSDLFLPLSDFEESYRIGALLHDGDLRLRSKELCLETIAQAFNLVVEHMADATPDTFSGVLRGLLPWAKVASISFLKILPSLRSEPSAQVDALTESIVDNMEWLLLRNFGFPGSYFESDAREQFEHTRSLVALAYGIFVMCDEAVQERFQELRLPQADGARLLGTTILHSMKRVGVEQASEWAKDLARDQLEKICQPHELSSQASIEALALSWHLGAGEPSDFRQALEFSRNPTAQLLCAKALSDPDPWSRAL